MHRVGIGLKMGWSSLVGGGYPLIRLNLWAPAGSEGQGSVPVPFIQKAALSSSLSLLSLISIAALCLLSHSLLPPPGSSCAPVALVIRSLSSPLIWNFLWKILRPVLSVVCS
ncbi:uncharacterized protein BDW43DRAFT_108645 [Aspergillus alliaceus]|uniref:uncharacterized protein n=1 Tax=Petromyces alliaceus TaxID=209559 RepID=UPI0012A62748|nr:uncharacterized protein BDW43DRAFT_108645 [Aspergillus alliaceus]KAB8232401.1 hypothetical protein BDW43DRAFT_108645 [Aspergillus alliaceus]